MIHQNIMPNQNAPRLFCTGLSLCIVVVLVFGAVAPIAAQDTFMGEIKLFAGNFAPRNWAYCDGQLLSIASNTALFSILGTTYGGDGRTTFGLPDLRGRVPLGPRTGPGLSSYMLGQRGGAERVTMSVSQMPSHTHIPRTTVHATSTTGTSDDPDGNLIAQNAASTPQFSDAPAPNVTMNSSTVTVINENTGGSQPHENRPPYIGLNYIICVQGLYPSRP